MSVDTTMMLCIAASLVVFFLHSVATGTERCTISWYTHITKNEIKSTTRKDQLARAWLIRDMASSYAHTQTAIFFLLAVIDYFSPFLAGTGLMVVWAYQLWWYADAKKTFGTPWLTHAVQQYRQEYKLGIALICETYPQLR